jgi:hypothetical protein
VNLTPELTRQLWAYMCDVYGTTVVRKQDAWMMRLAARVLSTPGFLDGYVTTLWGTIYVPFEIGNDEPFTGSDGVGHVWSLEAQVAVCAHEHQHVSQEYRDGWKYSWRYATSTAARAVYETEAYRTTLEMKWALGATEHELETSALHYAVGLRNYGCTTRDVDTAIRELGIAVGEITRGIVKTEAAQVALEYLHGLQRI